MVIRISGNRKECRNWMIQIRRLMQEKTNYIGVEIEKDVWEYIIRIGTKEDCPRMRTVRKLAGKSEEIGERIIGTE